MTIEHRIKKLPTWVEGNSYAAQCDMRDRSAGVAASYVAALEQLLFATSGVAWLLADDNKPDLQQFHRDAMERAFAACMINGAFQDIDSETVSDVYGWLTAA